MSDLIRVQDGQSLEAIARLHHLTLQRLEELNREKQFDLAAADGNPRSPGLKPGMRDPDSLVVGEKLRVEAPAPAQPAAAPKPPAPPAVKPLSDQALTAQLKAQVARAKDVAEGDKSINDPLRLLAQQDPVAYAQHVVGAKYGTDRKSATQLADCAQRLRVDDTTRKVKALMDPPDGKAAQPLEAAKLLDQAMDSPGVTTASQRSELWKKAGEPFFNQAFFKKQLHDAAYTGRFGKPDAEAGNWMLAFSKNAPAEASRELLDVFLKHDFDADTVPKFNVPFDTRDRTNPALFKALSTLVQKGAGIPGDSRADKVAHWLLGWGGGMSPTRLESLGPLAVRASVGDGSGSRLAMALIDGTKNRPALADLREQLLKQTAQGGDDLRARAAASRKGWQDAMPKNLSWTLDYFVDPADPKAVTKAVELYRASDPKGADAMDRAALKSSRDTADVYAFVNDSGRLDVGKEPATAGERQLGTTLGGIDDDKPLLRGLQASVDTQRLLLRRGGYGERPLDALPVPPATHLYELSQQSFLVRNGKNILQMGLQEITKQKVRNLLAAREGDTAHLQESTFSYLKKVAPLYGVSEADAGKLVDRAAALAKGPDATTEAARARYVEDLTKFNEDIGSLKKTYGQVAGDFGNVLKAVNVATFATNIASWGEGTPGITPLPPNVMVLGNIALGMRDAGGLVAQVPGLSKVFGGGTLSGKVDAFLKSLGDKTTFAKFTGAAGMASLSLAGYEYAIQDGIHGDIPLVGFDSLLSLGAGGSAFATMLGADAPAWMNPLGITLLAAGVIGRVSYKQYENVSHSNAMEPSKDPKLLGFLQQLGFGKDVATHLLDQTHHGLSPMIALDAWAQKRGLSRTELYRFLNALPEDDVKRVVSAAHEVVDANDQRLADDKVAPQDKIPEQWLGYLSETLDHQSAKPPLGSRVVTDPLDGVELRKPIVGPSTPLASFTQLARAWQDDLATVHYTGPDKAVIADRPAVLQQEALDQLFKLNPQYDRALLDGNPNTPRGRGVQGLDPDAVKVGTRLNVGVGADGPLI
jgi:hypothetical protein